MNGEEVPVLLTDDHSIHVLEHSCILNSLEARKRPDIVQLVTAHIQAHLDTAKQMPAELAAMLKQTSFAPPPAPPQAPMPQQGGVTPEMVNPQPPLEQQAAPGEVALPSPAQSPLPPLG